MRLSAAASEVVKGRDERIRELQARVKEAAADIKARDKKIASLEGRLEKMGAVIGEMREKIRRQNRRLRYHEGPSAPGVKNRADRERDKEAKRKEAEKSGGKKRKPGAQPGHKANRRTYTATRTVVIDEGDDRACEDGECGGERRVTGYVSRFMVEKKQPPKPETIESLCPKWACSGGCGRRGVTTRGTGVPLHMFRPREGDAAPSAAGGGEARGEGEEAAGAPAAVPNGGAAAGTAEENCRAAGPGEGATQGPPAPAAGPAAEHGAEIDWAGINDIPDSADEPFFVQNPRRGAFGHNVMAEAVMQWLYRLPIRKIRAALKAGGLDVSVGTVCRIVMDAGSALVPVMNGNAELLRRRAKMIHADKTSYRVNGKRWNFWVFYDPQNKIVVYWLTPDKDKDVLDAVLGDWDGIIICDGARVFDRYEKKQRCWAHIRRESGYIRRNNPESALARRVDDRLGKIYHDSRRYRGSARGRKKKRHEFSRRVRALADECKDDEATAELSVTLRNAAFDLFYFVVDPEVPTTNNAAEQLLREPVVVRKIRGSLRAARSAMPVCALLACTTTWARQGLDPMLELKKVF